MNPLARIPGSAPEVGLWSHRIYSAICRIQYSDIDIECLLRVKGNQFVIYEHPNKNVKKELVCHKWDINIQSRTRWVAI